MRKLFDYPFALGPGTETEFIEVPFDLSRARVMAIELRVDAASEDATDTLDVALQQTTDGVAWHDKAKMEQITGDMSPSATAPEYRFQSINLTAEGLAASEENYEPSGSVGGVALANGEIIHGPLWGNRRAVAGGRAANVRIGLAFTDADNDGAMTGNVAVYIDAPHL